MSDGFKIDTRDFDKALVIYSQAVEKDSAYIINRTALNCVFKTAQATPLGDASDIMGLPKRSWWPKFVAKRLGKGYKRKQARAWSKKEIKRRIRARGLIRSGWVPAMRALAALKAKGRALRVRIDGTSQFKRPKGFARVARPGVYVRAVIANNTRGATEHPEYLQRGLDAAAADMLDYARKLMSDTAREHSAK